MLAGLTVDAELVGAVAAGEGAETGSEAVPVLDAGAGVGAGDDVEAAGVCDVEAAGAVGAGDVVALGAVDVDAGAVEAVVVLAVAEVDDAAEV